MSFPAPQGFQFGGMYCGIKSDPQKHDLALIVSSDPCTTAGVYTQNRIFAAPVGLDRSRTPSTTIRGIVTNSGNANACTGARGDADALAMVELAATSVGAPADSFLVLSTGIIGEFLPLETITNGIRELAGKLGPTPEHLVAAARGFLTTDTRHKLAGRTLTFGNRTIQLLGLCKGAAMIGPNMATMLGVLLTDAPLTKEDAQRLLTKAVSHSFNCLSVDGHMSTNDTVLLLANGLAGGEPLSGAELATFELAAEAVASELAYQIADDGEGTSHVIVLEVEGCASEADARTIAQTIANSALVKTAVAGADPNWGRIVSAAGYAEIPFDPKKVSLYVQGHKLYEMGAPVRFDKKVVSAAIRDNRETHVRLLLGEGSSKIRFWTTDLTQEYVRLNADYTT